MPRIVTRDRDDAVVAGLVASQIDPRMARLYAARGVRETADLDLNLAALLPPATLARIEEAAEFLAAAIAAKRKLLIVADYDADGATACAVGLKGLSAMGAIVDFIVPNRFTMGYGLTPEIVALASERKPDVLITVDNGIASVAGVAEAARRGIEVLVTDHHLPGDALPDAAVIVNPNQPGDAFPSKSLAGVGVMFYTLLALRALLRQRGAFEGATGPNLAELLDLVALGTVADVVRLDHNNRILVEQGLQRIRAGRACPGVVALLRVAGRDPLRATAYDLGFIAGPRVNAAGRLDDMSTGIACLVARDEATALRLATELDRLNRERREIEAGMKAGALAGLAEVDVTTQRTLTLFDPAWHQGVVGLLAGRIKDKAHRPVIAFAPDGQGFLRGSGRSIAGFHLRDALDLVSKKHPDLIVRFGGHAMAAGLTIRESAFAAFESAFEAVGNAWLNESDLALTVETDGALSANEIDFDFVRTLDKTVWGQGYPPPSFLGSMRVVDHRVVGEKHARLKVLMGGVTYEAMRFGSPDKLPAAFDAVYRPTINEFRGTATLQLTLDHVA
ncbi:MAG: single-stranded-DNA-specific exonuclease RecJ [Betaproteobacteria bacterium]|nr:single-stranded-DNA-specific exonuclease RecJ [Betaproteobacteria bacterium]